MLAASLVIHGAVALAFYDFAPEGAVEAGIGGDTIVIEKGIALETLVTSGEARETVEAVETAPQEALAAQHRLEEVQAPETPPAEEPPLPPEIKLAELPDQTEIVASPMGPEAEALKHAPEPLVDRKPEELKQPRPEQLASPEQLEIVAVEPQIAAAATRKGGDTTERLAYYGRVSKHIQKRTVKPQTRVAGTVIVRLTVDPSGRLLDRQVATSSGVPRLDDAAIASVDKSSPFPPFTNGMPAGPLVVSVPFKFLVR